VRRLASSILATALIATLAASPIAADTPDRQRNEFDRVQASFEFTDGGRDFTGQILIDRDTATGASIASFFFYSGVIVTCDNGTPDDPTDDFERQDLIDFTASEAQPATFSIGQNLSSATASATARGNRVHLEACTDVQTSSPDTVAWQLSMQATGPAVRTSQVDRFPNDDGTVSTQSVKVSVRPAAGSITIDGTSLTVHDASISHILVAISTR
jgi:hypothetical protein